MTRKHFRALATIIQENIRSEGYSDYRIHYNRFINDLCTFLRRENPRFDVAKFIEACTPPEGGRGVDSDWVLCEDLQRMA
jgi:hypothetical protein|tara:strand:- start:37 stop:276 length:240 start_codon:yes stop_codon:yes gene_type:complete